MTHTDPAVEAEFRRRLMSLTPEERLAMACRMFGAAKALARAGISATGAVSASEMRRQLFLRFYGDDFSEADRLKILAHLAAT